MRKKILYFTTIATILIFGACSEEQVFPEGKPGTERAISLTVSMLEDDPTTRVDLNLKENNSVTVTWVAGDQLQLLFVKGEIKLKRVVTLLAQNIKTEGKHAIFDIPIPEEITGTFDLYGVFGGGGLDFSNLTHALLPANADDATSLASVQSRKDVMLYFPKKALKTTDTTAGVNFKHLGSLFSIVLKNSSDESLNNLSEVRLIGAEDGNWAFNSGAGGKSFDLVNEVFLNTETAGNYLSFKAENSSLPSGESMTFWGWHPPLTNGLWPELKLELRDATTSLITSFNSTEERTRATVVGKSYYFFGVWDGSRLGVTDEFLSLPPSGSTDFLLTPIAELNQGPATINSHEDVTSRSSLKMNYRSYVGMGESSIGIRNARYPRVKKMANGGYIMFYHDSPGTVGSNCDYAISKDSQSWRSKGKLFNQYKIIDSKGNQNERRFSTCDGLVLSNGDILAVASYRADIGYRDLPRDAGVIMRRSTDNGVTWGEPVEIYQGVNWEPYLIELRSGEIQCYFTDSSRTGIVDRDTGTVMIVSNDGGNSWTPSFGNNPYYVLRTKFIQNSKIYFTNQMPCVIQLMGSNELVASMEAHKGSYHISLAYSGEDGEWDHLNVDQEGPEDRNDHMFVGGAPYLAQFPSGETVLSYNNNTIFYLKMGNAKARNFGENYSPFPGKWGYWGSLERMDDHRLIGVMPDTPTGKIVLAELILNHRIEATSRTVNVDGDNSEWANTDHALFVGSTSQAQATLRSSSDNDNVYFLVEVLDNNISIDDYTTIYINPVTNDDKLTSEGIRIRVSAEGMKSSDVYSGGWTGTDLGISVSTKYKGTLSNSSDTDTGYFAEISIPRSKLNIKSGEILVNFSIFDDLKEDAISKTSSTSTAKWIPIIGL